MEIATSRAHGNVEVAEAAHRDVESGDVSLDHAADEDNRCIRPSLVGSDPVDDREATDLILPVAGKPQVHGQLAGTC